MLPDDALPPETQPLNDNTTPIDPVPLSSVKTMRGPYIMLAGVLLLVIAFIATFTLPPSNVVLLVIAGAFLLALIGMVILCFEVAARARRSKVVAPFTISSEL